MFENLWQDLFGLGKRAKQRPTQGLRLEILEDRCLLSTAVAIVTNPINHTVMAGQSASFTAAATGNPTPTVQWEMNTPTNATFVPVTASSLFSGVTTNTLTVTGATAALSGDHFEALFTNGSGSVATTPAILLVSSTGAPTISHMSTNNWTQGQPNFPGAMTISGGTGPFTLVSDSGLPPGTTAVINGDKIQFTGLPSVAATFNPSITIEDAVGTSATKRFVIAVDPALIVGNLTQSQWTVGEAGFGGAITLSGGTGPFTLVSSTGLPNGMSAKVDGGTIRFTGTPTSAGTFANGSVTIADADGATVTQMVSITINAAPALSTLTVTQWTAGEAGFPDTLTITGGTGPYTIAGYGDLPFIPTAAGNTVFFSGPAANRTLLDGFVTIRDKTGAAVTETIPTFTVNLQPTITNLTATQWTVGQPGFSGTIAINFGTAPFTITNFNNLPNGLIPVINGSTIGFTGIPTAARSFGGNITFQDSGGATFTAHANININLPLTITTTSVPAVADGVHYSTTLKATGGTGADTFTLTGGSLPSGLVLGANGQIAGASSATGVFPFTAIVSDAIGDRFSDSFSLAIAPALAVGNLSLNQWTVNQPGFTGAMNIVGGDGSFTIAGYSGLPAGLTPSLNGHTIKFAGTPTAAGPSTGSITVTDANGVRFIATVAININAAPTLSSLSATTWTANAGGFPSTITITGGTGPYTIVNSHGIPFGVVVSGNTILFTGSASRGTYSNGTITIRDKAGAAVTQKIAPITINQALFITHMSNNNWTDGLAGFNGALTINGGTGPFTILDARNLPPGLTPVIQGNWIAFTGTPTAAKLFGDCIITLEDATGAVFTKTFLLDIAPPLTITTDHLRAWRSGANYSTLLRAAGGTGTRTFTLTKGSLPPGLTLNSNGKIHGKATASAAFTFTVTVTDAVGDTASETFTL